MLDRYANPLQLSVSEDFYFSINKSEVEDFAFVVFLLFFTSQRLFLLLLVHFHAALQSHFFLRACALRAYTRASFR